MTVNKSSSPTGKSRISVNRVLSVATNSNPFSMGGSYQRQPGTLEKVCQPSESMLLGSMGFCWVRPGVSSMSPPSSLPIITPPPPLPPTMIPPPPLPPTITLPLLFS
ncbi:MAG: hypothetical protein F6K17_35685 [Okeania sp. SIO3C4]|nr:hypothetical protein [Okeania sp. SIO3C4]